jgi:hypothetical protein
MTKFDVKINRNNWQNHTISPDEEMRKLTYF